MEKQQEGAEQEFPVWVCMSGLSKYTLPDPILGGSERAGLNGQGKLRFESKTLISEVLVTFSVRPLLTTVLFSIWKEAPIPLCGGRLSSSPWGV